MKKLKTCGFEKKYSRVSYLLETLNHCELYCCWQLIGLFSLLGIVASDSCSRYVGKLLNRSQPMTVRLSLSAKQNLKIVSLAACLSFSRSSNATTNATDLPKFACHRRFWMEVDLLSYEEESFEILLQLQKSSLPSEPYLIYWIESVCFKRQFEMALGHMATPFNCYLYT